MEKNEKKVQLFMLLFGLFVFGYTIYEFIIGKYSVTQSWIFVIEVIASIALIFLPQLFRKLFKLNVPTSIIYFYWFFLLISAFIGTGLHVISYISFWDKILHAVSPMLLTALGYGLIGFFMKRAKISETSPWLFLLFGFAFAGLCGVFWEFWEFGCDQFFNMNLQRYLTSGEVELIGRSALMDTMGDLITNTIGALIMGGYAWFMSKKNATYFENYRLTKCK
ncbi:hypothetical protein BAU15_14620 [Enterococcus sp. JM4C]|uniref:hypothetical protein n=1 Tax=Candidatus Enterococcus huntleyi TaxID=1857217 RepID=UPI00137980F4|nr:hypothetical protein [Enterococcus sp. JM4C]KAF1296573.1 hypothetical protein BAU15_14620 [Enterococcus sp. JM4C]